MSNEMELLTSEKSTGNVFEDLGFTDAKERFVKVQLAFKIATLIAKRKLKQVAAAKALGINQAKISLLVNGKIDDFSIDRLMEFLTKLDQDVEITIKRKPRSHSAGEIRVAV